MADITNPEAVRFANEKIRPLADALAQAYYACRALVDEWDSNSLNTVITNTNLDEIIDGARADGRHILTGSDARRIYDRALEFCTDYESTSRTKLKTVLEVAVNPVRR